MTPNLEHWKDELAGLPAGPANFERWFFVRCGAVLLGDKEGELVVLRPCPCLSLADKRAVAERLCRLWGLEAAQLWHTAGQANLLVYRVERLERGLRRVPAWVFASLGYARPASARDFVAALARSWSESGTIPHAVGLALGYPLKDVLGFTGLAPLACSGQCGWRVYGDPGRSLARKRSFVAASRRAAEFIAA